MSQSQLIQVADAIDRLPQGSDLDLLAATIEYFNDASLICRGEFDE
jgi:hypothetical protein